MEINIILILIVYTILIIGVLYTLKQVVPESVYTSIDINHDHFLYNGKKWYSYRLGDLIYKPELVTDKNDYHIKYKNSLASEIINSGKINSGKSILLLKNELIKRKLKNTDFLLHIRIGDVVAKFVKKWRDHYIKDEEWWNSLVNFIKVNEITRVIILAGCHTPECMDESWEYLENKKIFLEKNNIDVLYRLGNSPDEDILYVSDAKYFATTGGGYGTLLGELVESFGNIWYK